MQYQEENPYDARNTKTASSMSLWVRTSFVLTVSIMAVAWYQMTSHHSGIVPENTQVSSNINDGGDGKIFGLDDGLRGKERRRIKKNTQLHTNLHNEQMTNHTNEQVQNYETEGRTKDNKVHYHFNNEPMASTPTATTATAANLHTAAEVLKPAREEDTLDKTETHHDEVAVDKVEIHHNPSDGHENKHEYEHKLDEAERKQDNIVINDEELAFAEEEPNISVRFTNDFHQPVHVNWMNQETGDEKNVINTLHPNESKVIESHPGHTFVAFDDKRSIRNIFIIPFENKNHQDGNGNRIDQGSMTNVDLRVAMQENEYHSEPDTSQIGDKSASKSVAEPEHAHQRQQEMDPEPEQQPEHQRQDQQIEPLIIANFFNGYHESIHINWISFKMDEEERIIENVAPGESRMLESHQGHNFVAFNEERTFRQVFTVDVSNQDNKTKIFFHIANADQEDNEKIIREEEHRDHKHEQAPPKQEALAKFVNNFPQEVSVNWINPLTGNERTVISNIQPKSDASLQTHSGHKFVAYNKARTFRQVFVMNVKEGYTEIHKIQGSNHLVEL